MKIASIDCEIKLISIRINAELKPLINALSTGNEKLETERAKNKMKKQGLEKELAQLMLNMKECKDGKTIEKSLIELNLLK